MKEYKIAEGYFFPDGRLSEYFPEFIDISGQSESFSDLTLWQPGDVLIVPIYSENNIWIGHLSAGAPYNGKRPDLKIVRQLQELLYILSKRLTELKHHELIYESEQRYRMITEQSVLPIAVYYKDHYIYVNKAFTQQSGYSSKEILSWNLDEGRKLIHPDDLEKLQKFDRTNFPESDSVNKLLLRGIHKTGEIHWLERYSKKINYYGVDAQLIILLDRTKEFLAERNLQISEEHLKTLLNATDDSVLLINTDGLILNLNQNYADLVNADFTKLPGTSIWDLFSS